MRLFWAGLAGLALGALVLAAAPHAQLLNAGHLSVSVSQAERVFDNGGNPWPFFTVEPAVNYDQCGANCAYVATPDSGCAVNGSSYRPDYINFKADAGQTPAFRIGCFLASYSFKYIINISQNGPYVVNLVMANGGGSSATVSISLDNNPVAATASIPTTGSYDTFTTAVSGQFSATVGNHILKVACTTGDSTNNACGDFRSLQGAAASGGVLAGSILPTAPAGQTWALAFNDEFNGTSIDTNKWIVPCAGCAGRGGDILNTAAVTTFDGSHMVFTELQDAGGTGGEVSSIQWFGQGYYEVRMVPGDGWSLFWTVQNQDNNCAGDRTHGFESDIYENITSGGQSNLHWNGYSSCHQSQGCANYGISPTSEIVAGMWWQDNDLFFYIDGNQVCHITGPNGNPTSGSLMHSIILTVGGTQSGGHATLPTKYDWVRYYRLQ